MPEARSRAEKKFSEYAKILTTPLLATGGLTSEVLALNLTLGFVAVAFSTVGLDKLGDYLYHRGIAKPFYIRGYRLHHKKFVLAMIPSGYVVAATLVYLHFVRVLWSTFWPSAEITVALTVVCLMFDMSWDAFSSQKRFSFFHHEWVYFVVPAYAFTHLVALV